MRFALKLPGMGRGIIETDQSGRSSWYADSNGTAGTGRSPNSPVATIDEAYNLASAGDFVWVAEGHAENITGATDLVMDTAGVKVIGLGRGTRRPTLTFTATDSEIPISGAASELHNVVLTISGTKDVVVAVTVTGAHTLLQDVELKQPTATDEFVDAIIVTTGADYTVIDGLRFDGIATGGAGQSVINIPAALKNVRITNMWAVAACATGIIENVTAAAVDLVIQNVVLEQRHATRDECIMVTTTTTGFIIGAKLRTATDDTAGMDAISGDLDMQLYDIGIVNADAEIAMQHPISDLDRTDNTATTNFPFDASMV